MSAFIVRPLAEADVQEAFAWYEEQAQGLGHEFLRALDVCYATIERWPESYPVVYRGVPPGPVTALPLSGLLSGSADRDRGCGLRPWEAASTPLAAQDLTPNKGMKPTEVAPGKGTLGSVLLAAYCVS